MKTDHYPKMISKLCERLGALAFACGVAALMFFVIGYLLFILDGVFAKGAGR